MLNFSNISTVILAGGLGTRLRAVVHDKPKVLAEIMGKPFLTFLLEQLITAGAQEVVLCTGYLAGLIREELGDIYKSIRITYSEESKPLGTAGALRLALPLIKSNIVLVMNGDSYINADLNAFREWFLEKNPAAALLLSKVHDTGLYGKVELGKDSRIKRFEEKGGKAEPGWINAGIYFLKKKLIETIPARKVYSLERDFFPALIGDGLHGYVCSAKFLDIGIPESYSQADAFFTKVQI